MTVCYWLLLHPKSTDCAHYLHAKVRNGRGPNRTSWCCLPSIPLHHLRAAASELELGRHRKADSIHVRLHARHTCRASQSEMRSPFWLGIGISGRECYRRELPLNVMATRQAAAHPRTSPATALQSSAPLNPLGLPRSLRRQPTPALPRTPA